MAKITADMLRKNMEDVLAANMTREDKMRELSSHGVSIEQDEPPMWHREGTSAWAIYLDNDGKLRVLRMPAAAVQSGAFI